MLIRCSKCSKEYLLNPDKLPSPKFLEGQGEGWWMSCENCNHQWWNQTKKTPSQRSVASAPISGFQNFTNLAGLQKVDRESEPTSEKITPEFYKSFDKDKSRSTSSEEVIAVAARVLKADPKSIKRVLSAPRIALTLFVMFFIGVLGALSFVYKDQLCPAIQDVLFPPQQSLAALAAPLVLQNVKYGVQPTADGKMSLTVVGEILNDNPSTVTLLPVRIVVWSHCPENASIQTTVSGANCIKADWQHPWTRPHILPGERLWFQTGTVLSADTQIVRVDVTLP